MTCACTGGRGGRGGRAGRAFGRGSIGTSQRGAGFKRPSDGATADGQQADKRQKGVANGTPGAAGQGGALASLALYGSDDEAGAGPSDSALDVSGETYCSINRV